MKKTAVILLAFLFILSSCNSKQNKLQTTSKPSGNWYDDAVLYEVNIRQYTQEGTFNAFAQHLPRLKKLGVEILWIMPVQPISEKGKKGTLGSYYSVADYTKINPEFGTMDDFKSLVKESHKLGMKVIIDWVANHTGWDNPWITMHPEWYTKDSTGAIIPPDPDWTDVADLNYDIPEMRKAMIASMDFWLKETNIDGFRCDVAWGVPADFWDAARASFDSIKPVYMLAEDEEHTAFLHHAFQSNYAWELHHLMNDVAKGDKTAADLRNYFTKAKDKYPKGSFPMQFITNHDENSWNGTIDERMGDAADAFAVFSFTVPGIPLIYSGQEAGLNKRLEFFEKDPIDWTVNPQKADFYAKLIKLKQENTALWNGTAGGNIRFIETSAPKTLLAFKRKKGKDEVVVLLNLSDQKLSGTIKMEKTNFRNYFNNNKTEVDNTTKIIIAPWGYKVFIKTTNEG